MPVFVILASISSLWMRKITIPTSPGGCKDQNVRNCLIFEEIERTRTHFRNVVFPIRERCLRWQTLFTNILGSSWIMDNDKSLCLPWAILYLTSSNHCPNTNECFSSWAKTTCYIKHPTNMLFKRKERNIRDTVSPSPGNVQGGP